MLDLLADLGRASTLALWVPVLLWTGLALLTEAVLRLVRAESDLALPLRGATLAALPLAVALPALLRALAPDAADAVAAVAPVAVASLPEIVVGTAPVPTAIPVASGPPAFDVLLGAAVVLAGLIAFTALIRLGVAVSATVRTSRRLESAPEAVQQRLDAMCARLGVVRRVRAVASPPETPPFTVGWRRPVVAVPDGLGGDALDLALLHEAAHVGRSDFAWHAAQRTVTALFAAHPLAHVLGKGLDLDRERAADAAVLDAHPGRRRAYADLLFSFASAPAPPLALGATPGSSTLKTRLDAMTRRSSPLRRAWMAHAGRLGGALMLVLSLALTLSVSAQPPPPPPPPPPDDPREWVRYSETNGVPEVIVQLRADKGRSDAEAAADRYHKPGAPGRLEIRYNGGVIERSGVDLEQMPPPPPPPPSNAPPPPPPPPPPPGYGSDVSVGTPSGALLNGLRADRDTTDEVFMVVEEQPVLIGGLSGIQERLQYPEIQRRAGVEGTTILQFVVSAGGAVEDIEVLRSAGNDGLDRAATEAVRAARFEPGRQSGEAVRVKFAVPVTFRIGDAPPPPPRPPARTSVGDPEVFEVVEEMPQLIGGLEDLQNRVQYPPLARDAGIEGQVVVQFVVDESGRVEDAVVIRSPDDMLSEAALLAVRASEFVAGRQGGEAVKTRFAVPVTFRLPGTEADD